MSKMMCNKESILNSDTQKIMISGYGGQGVLDLGNFVAYQALRGGKRVVYTPTYGPETRGGKVRCWVTTSNKEIDSPIAEVLDVLLILNKPSMDFIPQLRPNGLLLYNISIIDRSVDRDDISVVPVPCTDLAASLSVDLYLDSEKQVDTTKTLNCVMYGAFLNRMGFNEKLALKEAEHSLREVFKEDKSRFIPMNLSAVKKGYHAIEKINP
jgi:2-oxoglutarate ferredoxin oxidoreductase subunit gamma